MSTDSRANSRNVNHKGLAISCTAAKLVSAEPREIQKYGEEQQDFSNFSLAQEEILPEVATLSTSASVL